MAAGESKGGSVTAEQPSPETAAALEKLREKLLDISLRNRLIHSPVGKDRGRQLAVVDELSDEIFEILHLQGKQMRFAPSQDEAPAASSDEDEEDVYLPNGQGESTPPAAHHVDRILQTRLTPDRLQKRLLNLYRSAREVEEEQGVSVLFLALGFLRWYESDSSELARHAPLILLPVDIERSNAKGRFRLTRRDQDLEPNLSLGAKLTNDFGLKLPDLPENDEWLPSDYFERVASAVSPQKRWRVLPNTMELSFYSFAKFLMWRDLDPENLNPDSAGSGMEQLLGGTGFEPGASLFAADENLDRRFPDIKELGHILDADTSQTQVLAAARKGRNLVVQGPPGTGKSQTIANMIAGAVLDGKRVLFVAEKRAALDVVHDRLVRCGLGPLCLELHSHKANRRLVYEDLKRTLDLGRPAEVGKHEYARLRQVRDALNQLSALLHRVDETTGETPYRVLGRLAALAEQACPPPDLRIAGSAGWSRDEFEERAAAVRTLAERTGEHGSERGHRWRGVRRRLGPMDRKRLTDALRVGIGRLDALQEEFQTVHGTGATHLEAIESTLELLGSLSEQPSGTRELLLENPALFSRLDRSITLCQTVHSFQSLRDGLRSEVTENALSQEWDEVRSRIAQSGKGWFRWFDAGYRDAAGQLRSAQRSADRKLDHRERLALLDRLLECRRSAEAIRQDDAPAGREIFGHSWSDEETKVETLLPALRWAAAQAERLGSAAAAREQLAAIPPKSALRSLAGRLQKALSAWPAAWDEIAALVELDLKETFGVENAEAIPLVTLRERLSSWAADPQGAEDWHRLSAAARGVSELGLDEFREHLAEGRLSVEHAGQTLEWVRAEAVWNRLRAGEPQLDSIDGEDRTRKVEEFKALDRKLLDLTAGQVALKHFQALPLGAAGQIGLVRRELAKKKRHLKLRQLLDDAGEAVAAIKPVFLMSPLSIAQYLKPGRLTFDLLLIDEASQVRPADAMGAVMRCRQLVVVGDQKQLPPTSFFDREVAVEEDDEDPYAVQAGDMESILSLCEARGMPGGMLRWHYRSQHPSLIAVSNHEFYEDRLVFPPSPRSSGDRTGLSFVPVNGVYERGRSRRNPEEAEAVAEAVLVHAREHPGETLGVVALSVAQRDAIRNRMEFRRAEFSELEAFCREGEDEAFFVKNLENVQGDERDVIFISIGYGKDEDGYFSQNFGPVSSEGGERRLNVLFTRARKSCRVFASIRHDDIRLDTARRAGPRVLKRYLQYAETGEMDIPIPTGGEPDSPFEEAVASALQSHGYRVAAQVGSAGFRIDLAVYDPDDAGRFLLAVECDGARYHSSNWARERDRLRQSVLEQKGWTFHRIWSTDWFYGRDRELEKLLEAIERTRTGGASAGSGAAPPPQTPVVRSEGAPGRSLDLRPYRESDFVIPESGGCELWEAEPACLERHVAQIVEVEGPVHEDEVVRRLCSLWGYRRTGSRIRSSVEAAIRRAVEMRRIHWNGGEADRFLHRRVEDQEVPVRDRRAVGSAGLRKVERLPPAEVRTAILLAVERSVGISAPECADEVARIFDLRPGRDMRALVEQMAAQLVAAGRLERRANELRCC